MNIQSLCVKNIIEDDKEFTLYSASEDDTVETVLVLLRNHKISSLLIRKSIPRADNHNVGIIDILDILTFAYTKFAKVSLLAQDSYDQMEAFNKQRIGDLMNISGRNDWHFIAYNKPLSDLLSLLSNPHIHRVSVVNEQNDIVGFITQSKILQFFYKYRDQLEPSLSKLLNTKVVDSKINTSVVSVNMSSFMIEAFRLIWEKSVTGIAVVDDTGKLVATVSASDLKKLRIAPIGELIKDLYQPIKNFLHIRSNVKDKVEMAEFPCPQENLKVAKGDDTMETIFSIMVENSIHRVFIVDDTWHPTGVVSLRDIIARILEASEN